MSNRSEIRRAGRPTRVRGGCDDCDAYTDIPADPLAPGVTILRVYHDDTCPALARRERRS